MALPPTSKLPQSAQPAEPAPDAIRAQLERVIASQPFRSSRRCSDFLRYVTEGKVQGRTESLKERALGVAVFDRAPDYDTSQDPIVRNTAGQVRKRLAQYYHEHGHEGELRIDLPSGSYVPEFSKPIHAPPAEPVATAKPARRIWPWVIAGLLVLALSGTYFGLSRESSVDRFWAPLVEHSGSVVLCVGQGHTYKLLGDWDRLFEAGRQTGSVSVTEIVPAWDRYAAMTDVNVVTRLTALFTRYGKDVELKGGRTTSLGDLRGRTVVLIGALNNEWTLNLTGELRFYFETDPLNRIDLVRDRQNPNHREWAVQSDLAPRQETTDYAIVSRVHNPTTEQAVVVAAGIRGGGTIAAGEFLVNPSYLAKALENAPRDWQKKNVQFVLATRMFSGTPGPPAVVASHFW